MSLVDQSPQTRGARRGAVALYLVRQHPYTAISIMVLIAMGIGAVAKHSSEWDEIYVGSARILLRGGDIYKSLRFNTYPPFGAWLMMPFTALPMRLARAAWFAVSAVSLIYLVQKSWRLAGGGALEKSVGVPAAPRREQLAFLLGHAVALQLALNGLTHLQTDLLIAALLTAGCAQIAAGRFLRSAIWIGVAAAFKATPLLFAPYLLWRRQWLAAALLVGTMAGVSLLPDTVHRPADRRPWLVHWADQYLKPMTRADYVPGDWKNQLNNNQAIAGAVNRWFTTSWNEDPDAYLHAKPPTGSTKTRMRFAHAAACVAMLAAVLWSVWPRPMGRFKKAPAPRDGAASRFGATDPEITGGDRGVSKSEVALHLSPSHDAALRQGEPILQTAVMLECGMVMLLMLLLSPNSSRAHFCIMYLPAFCVARLAVRPRASWVLRGFLAMAVICATLSIHLRFPITTSAEHLMLWVGVVMLSAIFLLMACAMARRDLGNYVQIPHGRNASPQDSRRFPGPEAVRPPLSLNLQ